MSQKHMEINMNDSSTYYTISLEQVLQNIIMAYWKQRFGLIVYEGVDNMTTWGINERPWDTWASTLYAHYLGFSARTQTRGTEKHVKLHTGIMNIFLPPVPVGLVTK